MQQPSKSETKNTTPPYYHATMMYHTTARNVGLYTSLSLASLGAARALLSRDLHGSAAAFGACSVLFLALAMELNQALLWPTPSAAAAPTSRRVPVALAIAHALMCIAMFVAIWRGTTKFRNRK
jgi:hypothetical protein